MIERTEVPSKEDIATGILKWLEANRFGGLGFIHTPNGISVGMLPPDYVEAVIRWMQVRMVQDDFSELGNRLDIVESHLEGIIERLDRIEQRQIHTP